jgi:hypothetical protein
MVKQFLAERTKMNLFSTGLVIIGVAWVVQLISVLRGNQSILKAFVAIYILGVLLLVINDFREGINWMGWFEFGTMMAAILVLVRLFFKKENWK